MIIAGLTIFGIILGSFVNALVWRIHEQAQAKKSKPKNGKTAVSSVSAQDLSIMKGRSMCPHCHHTLAAKDLVPVLSWVSLRGNCRYCHTPISWQYPVVELLTGGLFVLSYVCWPYVLHGVGLFQFVVWLAFLVGFVALAVYDLRWFLLPDRIVAPVTALAVAEVVTTAIWLHSFSALWEPVVGAVIIFGLFWALYQVSDGTWIGGGDVKLAIALGLLAGTALHAFMVIFFASLLGTIISIPLLVQGKKGLKLRIPFGPYLLLATCIVVLFGASIVHWYQSLLVL